MSNRRLTQRLIDTLKPGKSALELRDTELRGFGVRDPAFRSQAIFRSRSEQWTARVDGHRRCRHDARWTEARSSARSHLAALRNGEPSHSEEATGRDSVRGCRRGRRFAVTPETGNRARSAVNRAIPEEPDPSPVQRTADRCDHEQGYPAMVRLPPFDSSCRRPGGAGPVGNHAVEAEALGYRPEGSNPCRNIRRYRRRGRERYLSREETRRLGTVLAKHDGTSPGRRRQAFAPDRLPTKRDHDPAMGGLPRRPSLPEGQQDGTANRLAVPPPPAMSSTACPERACGFFRERLDPSSDIESEPGSGEMLREEADLGIFAFMIFDIRTRALPCRPVRPFSPSAACSVTASRRRP